MYKTLWYLLIVPGIPTTALFVWLNFFVRRREKRSRRPFNEMPRPAGWSLQNRAEALMGNFTLDFTMAILAGVVAWALTEKAKGSPALFLVAGFVGCSFLMIRAAGTALKCVNHRLGLLGEQLVGHMLDQLTSDSIRVFHDYEVSEPGKKPWNIDHIVLTPAGVFAIETKTRRKPRGIAPNGQQGHKVIYDGQMLHLPAPLKADRHGLDQAQRNADWLSKKLSDLNGNPVPVTPILVLPGWYVEIKGKGPVIVLNPKNIGSLLTVRTPVLSAERQKAIANQLEERCRIDLSKP